MRVNVNTEKGAADRRLAHIFFDYKSNRLVCESGAVTFCGLLLSLPNVYPAQKQVMPKPTTAMKSIILILPLW